MPIRKHHRAFACLALGLILAGALVACGGGGGGPVAPPRTLRYTAIGASDAVGIGAFPLSNGYVPRLGARMGTLASNVVVANLGRNGWEVDEMVAVQLPEAIASNPDVVTVWTGSNDLIAGANPDAFAASLGQLLGGLAQQTDALVCVADLVDLSQAPAFRNQPDPDVTPERVAAFNARIRAAVSAHGAVLVELSALPFDDDLFWIDGFHPNDDGHAAIADAFWASIAARL